VGLFVGVLEGLRVAVIVGVWEDVGEIDGVRVGPTGVAVIVAVRVGVCVGVRVGLREGLSVGEEVGVSVAAGGTVGVGPTSMDPPLTAQFGESPPSSKQPLGLESGGAQPALENSTRLKPLASPLNVIVASVTLLPGMSPVQAMVRQTAPSTPALAAKKQPAPETAAPPTTPPIGTPRRLAL
jgi:hypothetical protein